MSVSNSTRNQRVERWYLSRRSCVSLIYSHSLQRFCNWFVAVKSRAKTETLKMTNFPQPRITFHSDRGADRGDMTSSYSAAALSSMFLHQRLRARENEAISWLTTISKGNFIG